MNCKCTLELWFPVSSRFPVKEGKNTLHYHQPNRVSQKISSGQKINNLCIIRTAQGKVILAPITKKPIPVIPHQNTVNKKQLYFKSINLGRKYQLCSYKAARSQHLKKVPSFSWEKFKIRGGVGGPRKSKSPKFPDGIQDWKKMTHYHLALLYFWVTGASHIAWKMVAPQDVHHCNSLLWGGSDLIQHL